MDCFLCAIFRTIFFITIVFSFQARSDSVDYAHILKQAQATVDSDPQRSLGLYLQHQSAIDNQSEQLQLFWMMTALKAAKALSDVELMEKILLKASQYSQTIVKNAMFSSYYLLAGSWFRKNGYMEQAEQAYQCLVSNSLDREVQLKAQINLGVLSRNLDDNYQAIHHYHKAQLLAEQLNDDSLNAIIANNLSVVYLLEKEFKLAEKYSKQAMFINQKVENSSFESLATLNLLWALAASDQFDKYQRVHPQAVKRVTKLNHAVQQSYLLWIDALFYYRSTGAKLSVDQEEALLKVYQDMQDSGISSLLQTIAKEINVPLPVSEKNNELNKKYSGNIVALLDACR